RTRRKKICSRASEIGGGVCAGEELAAGRRADELDEEVGGCVSGVCGESEGRTLHGRGWGRVCGFVLGRYGRGDRGFAGSGGGGRVLGGSRGGWDCGACA